MLKPIIAGAVIVATITIEWSALTVALGIVSFVTGAATVYLRIFIRAELLSTEQKIFEKISETYQTTELAEEKQKAVTERLGTLTHAVRGVRQDVAEVKKDVAEVKKDVAEVSRKI